MFQARWLVLALLASAACGPSAVRGDGGGGSGGDDGGGSNAVCTPACTGNGVCSNGQCVSSCQAAADSKSSIGCDYYSVAPDVISIDYGACFAAYVANTSNEQVTLTVDRGGVDLPVQNFARIPTGQGQNITYAPLTNGTLAPGQIAILFLARFGTVSEDCPAGITPAFTTADAAVHGTGRGTAFHITTSAPTIAYDIYPYGGGDAAVTSATLLLPTSVWDTNYVGVDAYPKSAVAGPDAAPFVAVVGKEAGTTVTIRPTAAIAGGPQVPASAAGIATSFTVNQGEVLQFTQNAELAGSAITSDKPIGLWGGASCLNIPVNKAACDSSHQQIPPVQAMGNHYAAVRYRNRYQGVEETVPWRFVGAVDGTTLTYSPSTPAGAPTTLAKGQVAEVSSPGQFVVSSQDIDHPFYMSAHMTGYEAVSGATGDNRGDPEFVNIIPPEQYL
ncbi:MAG TPA: IgGFc-binding protein, partial [Kofleriaceae bacterium]